MRCEHDIHTLFASTWETYFAARLLRTKSTTEDFARFLTHWDGSSNPAFHDTFLFNSPCDGHGCRAKSCDEGRCCVSSCESLSEIQARKRREAEFFAKQKTPSQPILGPVVWNFRDYGPGLWCTCEHYGRGPFPYVMPHRCSGCGARRMPWEWGLMSESEREQCDKEWEMRRHTGTSGVPGKRIAPAV